MTTLMTITPRATEKAYGQSQNNVYVFNVPLASNKQQIVAAVQSQFGVKVTNIKTLVQSARQSATTVASARTQVRLIVLTAKKRM